MRFSQQQAPATTKRRFLFIVTANNRRVFILPSATLIIVTFVGNHLCSKNSSMQHIFISTTKIIHCVIRRDRYRNVYNCFIRTLYAFNFFFFFSLFRNIEGQERGTLLHFTLICMERYVVAPRIYDYPYI